MHKFNGGLGSVVCDGCRKVLVDGTTQSSKYRVMSGSANRCGTPSHYCGWRCMLWHAETQPGDVKLILAQEAVQLRVIESIASDVPTHVVERLKRDLSSKTSE